jgi:hypothetical protein
MSPRSGSSRWRSLQAEAHSPEAQEVIRQEIFKGTIRVVPGPDGGIRIIPCETDDGPRSWALSAGREPDPGHRSQETVMSVGMPGSRVRSASHV